MPSIFSAIPAEIERKAPGTGGKPPVDRRPTGGGGGGGDDNWKNQPHGPRELLYRIRTFVLCALAGDMMFFVALVVMFYARQVDTHMDPRTLRQIDSSILTAETSLSGGPLEMVFIRAPRIVGTGAEVQVLALRDGSPTLVRQGAVMAATFHPELSADRRVHRFFVDIVNAARQRSVAEHEQPAISI